MKRKPAKRLRNQGLSLRLAQKTVIAATLLGLAIGFVQVLFDYYRVQENLRESINAALDISEVPAIQIAYNLDTRLASELVDGLLKHKAIVKAEIRDGDDNVLALRERDLSSGSYRSISDSLLGATRDNFVTNLSIDSLDGVILGKLSVVVDTYPYGFQFLQRAQVTLLSAVLNSLLLSAILFIICHLFLTKPLLRVIAASRKVNPEAPEKTRLPLPEGHEHDEIGDLVRATNSHLGLIDLNLDKRRQAEDQLKLYSAALEQKVSQRTHETMEKNAALLRSNRELSVAREAALKEARARADFLANMSHEIRTPFNGVLGMISLALEEPLTDRQKEQLGIAHRSGKALLDLLNDILDISKFESGNVNLESIPFSFRDQVEDTLKLLAPGAHGKHIALYNDIDPAYPDQVLGDPTRVRQVISNLVGNAIKFTDQGHVRVRLHYSRSGETCLEIEDTGIGIPQNKLESIFSPFSQADADITRRFGGTGLGLTLCHQLVSAMQGHIEVQSETGKGSLFRVRLALDCVQEATPIDFSESLKERRFHLIFNAKNCNLDYLEKHFSSWGLDTVCTRYHPDQRPDFLQHSFDANDLIFIDSRRFAEAVAGNASIRPGQVILVAKTHIPSDPDLLRMMKVSHLLIAPLSRHGLINTLNRLDEAPAQARSTEGHKTAALHRARVLLVEDNPVNQMVARAILNKMGFEAIIANNGKEAVDAVLQQRFDLVLMDCHMPVKDGFAATRAIREYPQFDRLPIIALTANVLHGDREKCLAAGMNDYMSKPYERESLQRMLDKWLFQPVKA